MLKIILLEIVGDIPLLARAYSAFSVGYLNGTMPAHGDGIVLLNLYTDSLNITLEGLNHETD